MDLLEHPLEAVAFRLYSLPIPEAAASAATGAAAAWTCLAAVLAAAAAAGLWRLRSSAPAAATVAVHTKKPLELDPSRAAEVSSREPASSPSSQQSPPEPAAAWTTPTAASPSPKERYTAYFRDAGCVGCCDEDGDENEEEEEDDEDDVAEEHEDDGDRDVFVPFGWGEVVRSLPPPLGLSPTTTAAAEMGRRYRRRSPTAALSVVQLWDQGGLSPPTPSPRRRGRVLAGTVVSAF